jgi:signal transduction histidine kinase/CheY-like chemotaxis protein/HPt (histidine-containing phosphotransfer) domain-containing protein
MDHRLKETCSNTTRETERRVLVLAPTGKDARATSEVLANARIAATICMDMVHLCREINSGSAAVLLTDESLRDEGSFKALSTALGIQPKWSDLPLVLLVSGGANSQFAIQALEGLQNVLVLDRPVHLPTLISALRTALRSRQHQYEIRDHVEERQRAQEALREAKAAAEAANAAKSQFLANISHELRTPMNAILGMIALALPKQADATARDFLATARESADLLLALLNDLLDSAKIESGNLELEAAPLSLRRLLEQLTRILSVRAGEKGLTLHCRIPDDTPDAVVGDKVRLRQVLLNLAGNAIKFTPRGEVTITMRVESVADGKACLEFAVRDTGIGIPPGDLERVFNPFAQADASTARKFGGTGLGLSISKSLVEMMSGRIWAESVLGQGSTFYFTACLPLATEAPQEREPAREIPGAPATPLRILLVEDNPANQKLAAFILKERGHAVEVAGNGHEALRLAGVNRYDVILMDVQMPVMDGVATTAAIRAREVGGKRMPIIAMTAHAMAGDRERFLAQGMDGYLSKPIDATEMITLIEGLAASEPLRRAESPSSELAPCSSPSSLVFDRDLAMKRCTGSEEIFESMAKCFSDECRTLFPELQAALVNGDLAELSRLGHRLKGTLVYLGAEPATKAATAVEQLRRDDRAAAREAVAALQRECDALVAALAIQPETAPLQGHSQ